MTLAGSIKIVWIGFIEGMEAKYISDYQFPSKIQFFALNKFLIALCEW